MAKRFWEVDVLRFIALLMMVIFHTVFDLVTWGDLGWEIKRGFWRVFNLTIPVLFIFVAGLSLSLLVSRSEMDKKNPLKPLVKHAIIILACAMLITAFTYVFDENGVIYFGILHCIGVSLLLAYPFTKFKYANLAFGAVFLGMGLYIDRLTFDFSWLYWLGFFPSGWKSPDYFPLLPWFGVLLFGLAIGNIFYSKYKRDFPLPALSENRLIKIISFPAKHTLLIYMLHQPLIIGILIVLGLIDRTKIF